MAPQPPSPRMHIGMTLDAMWSIKDYLLSGALNAISRDFQLTCWVPEDLIAATRRLAAEIGIKEVQFRVAPAERPSWLFNLVCGLQKSLLFERFDIDTERVMRMRQRGPSVVARSMLRRVAGRLIRVLAKSSLAPGLDRVLEACRLHLAHMDASRLELDAVKPDALFITDPVRREFDPLFFEARRRALLTVCLVLSWDNVTAKGRINSGYTRILVWNDSMRDDVRRLYPDLAADVVEVVGFPRFDAYRESLPPRFERAVFMESLGLDPSRPYILFANGATRSFRAQPQVVGHICDAMERGELPADTQLLVRCHPHDDVATYAPFRSRPGVVVWPDAARTGGKTLFELAPEADELLTLAASVRHSAVCVNPGSTVMLDAALADVPVVTVAYDGDLELPYWQSFRSCFEYSHQKQFHAFDATDLGHDRAGLIHAIDLALSEPDRKARERERAAEHFVGGRKDGSTVKLMRVLHDMFMQRSA